MIMLIATKNSEKLIAIQIGTGDNLFKEDIEAGYVDYVMTSIYNVDGEEITLEDSAQVLSSKLLEEMEEEEIVALVLEYWGLKDEDYVKAIM